MATFPIYLPESSAFKLNFEGRFHCKGDSVGNYIGFTGWGILLPLLKNGKQLRYVIDSIDVYPEYYVPINLKLRVYFLANLYDDVSHSGSSKFKSFYESEKMSIDDLSESPIWTSPLVDIPFDLIANKSSTLEDDTAWSGIQFYIRAYDNSSSSTLYSLNTKSHVEIY